MDAQTSVFEPINLAGTGELANKAFRVFLLGIEDVVGKNGMKLILRQADLLHY